ncbi:hypothetical protein H2200_006012 [Cladophialophora chaetospira]|uniref:Cytochrome P450 n=1 Tax=Cladophialophora chaetospira TaxID=386627 RepID=A0AA38XA60_9EURO|nr:hypothetical protein H2200_006012 [Cladophialophora chaetospira]
MASPIVVVAVVFLLAGFLVQRNVAKQKRVPKGARVPPGPPGKPLIGNLPDIPPQHSWLKFKTWADEYGPVFRLNIMGRNHVVVSTEKIANDLLRERGNLYSSREQLPFAAKLLSRDLRPLLLPYGELWRRGRKLMHTLTMPTAATSYQPLQIYESERLLFDLLRTPDKYEDLFERYAGGVIMRLAYGKTIETGDEPYIRDALKVVHTVERVASPGAYLVDTFPSLMYLPSWLAPFKREAASLHDFEIKLFRGLISEVKEKIKQDKAPRCFSTTFLEKQIEFGLSDDQGAYVIGTLFEAGAGTTAAALCSFCLAMVHYPEWQDEVQKEVDRVVGEERMPEFDDITKLPMVRAVTKEVLRWRPVTAGGVPHELVKDDVYDGLFFPAGTNVLIEDNRAIHRDPELYPNPEVFNPRRWLSPDYPTYREPLDKYLNLQNFSAFGFGRRICPGMNIAEKSLFILVARLAWAANIAKRPGFEVPWYDYTTGFNVQPKKFVFDITPRSTQKAMYIEQTWVEGRSRDPLAQS